MATKKATSAKKKSTVTKPVDATRKTTVRSFRAEENTVSKPAVVVVSEKAVRGKDAGILPDNIVAIVFGELFGAFVLTMIALLTLKEAYALYIGVAFTVLTLSVGAISGGHFNPAITFAKWTMRQLRPVLLPFYWGAQFLGAMLAVIVLNWITGNALHLDFSHLWNMDWSIFGIELVATAVLMFGFAAATSRKNIEVSPLARALSAGFAVVTGLVIGTALLASTQAAIDTSKITSLTAIPHQLRVKNVSANPAVALAMTEQSDSSYSGSFNKDEKQISRFSLEVLFGTLIGAALGGNLYLLIAGRKKN